MRITIDARMINHTGIGRYIRNILRNIAEIDGTNQYSALINDASESLKESGNIKFYTTRFKVPIYSIREQFMLLSDIRRQNPDLVHYPSFNVPRLCAVPAVVNIHDLTYLVQPEACPNFAARIYAGYMFRMTAKKAARIITGSEYTKKDIVKHLGVAPGRVTVIYNGVDSLFRPVEKGTEAERIAGKYGITGDFIFYVGNHGANKNLKRLLEAFSAFKRKDCQLILAGKTDPRRKSLYDLVGTLGLEGRARFIGAVPEEDLPYLYSMAKLFVFPSLQEGFGLPPLEAMACGTPVVSSDSTSLPEVVGDAAVLVDPADTGSIKDGMEKVLASQSLRSELKEKGLMRVKQFSWRVAAEKTLKVYEEVLNR